MKSGQVVEHERSTGCKGGQVVRYRKMELETHGGRDVTERSGRLSLNTLLSLVTPVVRTEDTKTQKLLRPRKRGTASETCNVRNEVKKPNDLSATGGNGNAKAGKGTKASSG